MHSDKQKEIALINESHRLEIADLQQSLSKLSIQIDDPSDKNYIKRLKKDLDELK